MSTNRMQTYDYAYLFTRLTASYRLSISFTSCITWSTADTRVAGRYEADRSVVDRSVVYRSVVDRLCC